ncbi:MAG: type II toxin-antitoxin system VapC family toxin [Bryobacteraceae bacterium]
MLTSDLAGPRPLLIDTHIWVWASGGSGGVGRFAAWIGPWLETAAREKRLLASVVSVWEIALKAQRGDLLVHGNLEAWLERQKQPPGVRVAPLHAKVAIESTVLPAWVRKSDGKEHRDPCDRFLVALARLKSATLITCDELILDYAKAGNLIACDARAGLKSRAD